MRHTISVVVQTQMILDACIQAATVQLYTDLIVSLHVQQYIHLLLSDVLYMHCMDATDSNIAQLTVTLMNSLVITENVNLNTICL